MRARIAVLVSLGLAACVEKGPPSRKIDPAFIQRNLLSAPPATLTTKVDADLDGKIVYLGNELDHSSLAPGDKLTIVHYWKVVSPPGDGWRVFSHLVGTAKEDWINVDYSDMRAGHPPESWQPGEIIRDEQTLTLPKGWKSPSAEILVGLYRRGGQGVSDRMKVTSGPVDAESRVIAAKLPVTGAGGPAGPAAKSAYRVVRAPSAMTIDGVADELPWAKAAWSPAFSDTEGGGAIGKGTRAKLMWDDQFLYVFAEVEDTDVFSDFKKTDDPLWKEDVVELFIDADGNRRGYVELQVNPNNAQFDAWFEKTRAQASDVSWSAGMKSAVAVHGTAEDRSDKDTGWDVEIAIPLGAVKGRDAAMAVSVPPKLGDKWKLNVVRVEKPKDAKQIAASSWSQIPIQDFHALDRMLTVEFADEEGNLAAAEPAPAGSSPAEAAPAIESTPGSARDPRELDPATPPPGEKPPVKKLLAPPPGAKPPAAATGSGPEETPE